MGIEEFSHWLKVMYVFLTLCAQIQLERSYGKAVAYLEWASYAEERKI